ncbi:oxidoreductase [Weissella soli]|uniref:oxidoreductase n=1 Tax=Weissella soli TaxID=155866 RepID=UPI0011BB0837|nr:NADH-dependent flavin oxidoreductase [Weissella soli]QEA35666.1 NADH-dependent flavin oxidoreductase [Weissella soli]GJM48290.1 NADH-dependent flavin oxidoreductase [Weissella soli]
MTYRFLNPIDLKHGAHLRNRIAMAPTTLDASFYDGHVSSEEVEYYAKRAGGPGMIIVETAYINDLGKGFPGQISIADDSLIAGLSRIAASIKNGGAKAVLQLHHAGRLTNHLLLNGEQPVAPSAIADPNGGERPKELTNAQINQIIEDYVQAVRRAIVAGFDGIEIHGANRFLPQQFFSRQSNHRQDKWGGKYTFILELMHRIAKKIEEVGAQHFIIGYRISPEETYEGGYRFSDAIELGNVLAEQGTLDYIHLSLFEAIGTPFMDKNVNIPLVTLFRESLDKNIALITVGGVRNATQAEVALAAGADIVAMGIQLMIEPKWVEKHARHEESAVRYIVSPADYDDLKIPEPTVKMWIEGALSHFVRFAKDEK